MWVFQSSVLNGFMEHVTCIMFSLPLGSSLPRYYADVCFSAELSHILSAFSVTPPEATLYTVLEHMRLSFSFPARDFARTISMPYTDE